jgi:hypothetical protein
MSREDEEQEYDPEAKPRRRKARKELQSDGESSQRSHTEDEQDPMTLSQLQPSKKRPPRRRASSADRSKKVIEYMTLF